MLAVEVFSRDVSHNKYQKTHMSIRPHHAHTYKTLSRNCFCLLAQPSSFEGMSTRDRLPKAHANHLPSLTVVMEPEHAHQLLKMIVEHRVVHACIDIVDSLGHDRVARKNVQRDAGRSEEGRRVHAQPAKVANDKATEFMWRREIEARDGVLWMCFEGDAILQHRREERGKEKAHETAGDGCTQLPLSTGNGAPTCSTHSSSHLMRLSSVSSANTLTMLGVTPSVPA
jgi:hypothetical protein